MSEYWGGPFVRARRFQVTHATDLQNHGLRMAVVPQIQYGRLNRIVFMELFVDEVPVFDRLYVTYRVNDGDFPNVTAVYERVRIEDNGGQLVVCVYRLVRRV